MKKQFFYTMLMASAVLAGCSSEKVVEEAGGENSPVEAGGEGYVTFNIQMPQVSGVTKANDEFSDGTPVPDEYRVQNAHLVLFTGDTESGATFCGAYPLGISNFATVGSADDQCTTEGQTTAKITKPTVVTNLYAYVIINHNGLVSSPTATTVTLGSTNVTTSTTFENFSRIILNNIGNTSTGMVMTNCPVNGNVGGSTAPTAALKTLATLDANKIYPTAAQAEANPAGEVFVERAAAKVTVTENITTAAELTTKPGVTYNKSTIKWALNNENQVYFNNRQMQAAWVPYVAYSLSDPKADGTPRATSKYRMVSNAAIHTGVYRTYWGEDVNYNMDKASFATNNVGFKTNPVASAITNALATSVYTTENTFDVDHQSSQYTTQVALAVTFNGGADFYTANTYGANNILQIPTAGSGEKVQDYIMTYLVNNNSAFKTWYDTKAENRITVTMTNGVDGHATVETLAKASGSADDLPDAITPALVNSAITFNYYANGLAYYHVRIKHFGDDETPWNRNNHDANTIAGVYKKVGANALSDDDAALNYLGRYGVLRNNWYNIEVTGIKQIGTPLPGDPNNPSDPWTPDTPDDEVENYISVKIHVTPWAIRRQSIIL